MNKPYVITINSVSGGGKTALAWLIHESLSPSLLFCFDDFDETNIIPEDLYEWSRQGADPLAIDCPGMGTAVAQAIQQGSVKYIILDCPLRRNHPRFAGIIDLAVLIDTPLDIAMARRFLRDYSPASGTSAEEKLNQLGMEMSHYLEKARFPYLETYKQKETYDLVLDGWLPLEDLRDQIMAEIKQSSAQ